MALRVFVAEYALVGLPRLLTTAFVFFGAAAVWDGSARGVFRLLLATTTAAQGAVPRPDRRLVDSESVDPLR